MRCARLQVDASARCAVINLPSHGKLNHYLEAASKLRRCMLRDSSLFRIRSPLYPFCPSSRVLSTCTTFGFFHCSRASLFREIVRFVATSARSLFLPSCAPLPRYLLRSTLYALRSTSFLPAANFRASFSRDTTPVGCRGYTFIFVNFAFRFCGAGETVLREPCPTWKCNFAEPNPPDTDAALNADATATNWGGFISVRRGTARWWVRWSRNW